VRVGVTGHMDITDETVPLVYAAVLEAVQGLPDLVGVSCIARGSDSVFARAVLDAGGALEVVLPSRDYRERKVDPDHAPLFDELLERAAQVETMDFDRAERAAYEAANEAMLRGCDMLIAVWDGRPGKPGGTASVVESAAHRIPVTVAWPDGAARSKEGANQ
jgi:hypothetical protein